jgi:RNA polymerase primary sigma factor
MPEAKVRHIMQIAKEPVSLEVPVGDEGNTTLGDFIEDPSSIPPMEAAMQSNLRVVIGEHLDGLSAREAKITFANRGQGDALVQCA